MKAQTAIIETRPLKERPGWFIDCVNDHSIFVVGSLDYLRRVQEDHTVANCLERGQQ